MEERAVRVIAGDIGGTKTRLGLFEVAGSGLTRLEEQTYASAEYAGLSEIVAAFLAAAHAACERAAFAIAGPVAGRTARTTNLPWLIDADAMESELALAPVHLLNDLEAVAYGVFELAADDFLTLNQGKPGVAGNAAIIAAGTGLGMAGLVWDGARHMPFPSEGGHADFAPADARQLELARFLARQLGHVSKERVLSGPGLVNIFRFLLHSTGSENPAWLIEAEQTGDPAAAIASAAGALSSRLAKQALDLFAAVYGAEVGNLALTMMATGGVYLGGGIAPKIVETLREPPFMNAFLAKGRLRPVLEAIPVRVILNDRAALIGAARFATLQPLGGA
jgi:glucokinase